MNRSTFLLPFGLLIFTAGCPQSETACTDDVRSSITLNVVDESGAAIDSATATYSVDGAAVEDCEAYGNGSIACGLELSGDFTVTVDADGFDPETIIQTVAKNECHVITEVLDITLYATGCTEEIVPSIEVTVTDGQGQEVTSGDVMWNMAAEDDLPEPCLQQGGNIWTCGEEVEGELIVEINNAGPYEAYAQLVTVDADECHVITEQLSAVLQYLPD